MKDKPDISTSAVARLGYEAWAEAYGQKPMPFHELPYEARRAWLRVAARIADWLEVAAKGIPEQWVDALDRVRYGNYEGATTHRQETNLKDKPYISNTTEPLSVPPTLDPWANRSAGVRCESCMWFVLKEQSEKPGLGRCRRHAPTMGGYPAVFVIDWCGDHKLK